MWIINRFIRNRWNVTESFCMCDSVSCTGSVNEIKTFVAFSNTWGDWQNCIVFLLFMRQDQVWRWMMALSLYDRGALYVTLTFPVLHRPIHSPWWSSGWSQLISSCLAAKIMPIFVAWTEITQPCDEYHFIMCFHNTPKWTTDFLRSGLHDKFQYSSSHWEKHIYISW
jgi:hypothetical protein